MLLQLLFIPIFKKKKKNLSLDITVIKAKSEYTH